MPSAEIRQGRSPVPKRDSTVLEVPISWTARKVAENAA